MKIVLGYVCVILAFALTSVALAQSKPETKATKAAARSVSVETISIGPVEIELVIDVDCGVEQAINPLRHRQARNVGVDTLVVAPSPTPPA